MKRINMNYEISINFNLTLKPETKLTIKFY